MWINSVDFIHEFTCEKMEGLNKANIKTFVFFAEIFPYDKITLLGLLKSDWRISIYVQTEFTTFTSDIL